MVKEHFESKLKEWEKLEDSNPKKRGRKKKLVSKTN